MPRGNHGIVVYCAVLLLYGPEEVPQHRRATIKGRGSAVQ